MKTYTEAAVPPQRGKTVLITGANTGIGFEAARVLAARGARVVLACRGEEKGEDAIRRIRSAHPDADLGCVSIDLANLGSVADAARRLDDEKRLDLLINNAGVMLPPGTTTRDGFEMHFGVNYLGHFALTGHLFPQLAATPGARVVQVSSLAHHRGRIDFGDARAERPRSKLLRYAMSKAANLYFTVELARRCKAAEIGVTSVACHPGYARTDLGRSFPGWFSSFVPAMLGLFNTAREGALPTLLAATAPHARAGDYFGPTRLGERAKSAGPARMARHIRNPDVARELWERSVEWSGVVYRSGSNRRL